MFNLKDNVVVVTGASSGLGKQMAKAFAEQGASIVLMARRIERLEELKQELESKGTKCLAIKCDVTDSTNVNEAAKKTKEVFGKVDVLVNCAGSAKSAGVLNMTNEEWDFTISTDLDSVFYVTRAFANIMKERNYGRIINISSIFGLVGNMSLPTVAYHSSKGGVVNFTRAVSAELAKFGITCNAICPGYFITELTEETFKIEAVKNRMLMAVPMGRYGEEGELNSGAIFLAAKESSYVTGAILPIDGGYTAV